MPSLGADTEIVDTDSDDELPPGWEERVTVDGKVYYANHREHTTQWDHPTSGRKKKVSGELPYGWERKVNEAAGIVYYVDHVNKKTTYTDPRLAFAVEDRGDVPALQIKQRFDGNSTALHILQGRDLTGKYAVVTGANCGIGFETARSLARHGATVILACRNQERAREASRQILQELPEAKVEIMEIDLSSLSSVKFFAEEYITRKWPLHMLILNAGVFASPYTVTEDGYESTFQINHLSHFYLTQLLRDCLISSSPARVVVVSSESHRFADLTVDSVTEKVLSPERSNYHYLSTYNLTKLLNVLFSNELNRRMQAHNVTSVALHPGNMMSSQISRQSWLMRILFAFARPFTKSMQQGAATTIYCATASELEGLGGFYFNNCFQCVPSKTALRTDVAVALWLKSEDMIDKALKKDRNYSASER